MKHAKVMAAILAIVLTILNVTACFAEQALDTNGKSAEFTYMISSSLTSFINDYDESPAVRYWLDREWDANHDGRTQKLTIDFWAPTAGAEADYTNTLLSTGDYADVMAINYASQSAAALYAEGIALDLTEYVKQYMPNYLAYMAEHPEIHYTNLIDGEPRIIQLYNINNPHDDAWGGLVYRRDWIVKYGVNPVTGAAFTGEWKDGEWVDDVVFPSGNADPIYISDLEWMFEIFDRAMAELGITDGYAVQTGYQGAYAAGDFLSGFGSIGYSAYVDTDGHASLGVTKPGFRAYAECMANWYAKGWLDPYFAEHASDLFFMIDMASVYSGKVGMWYGLTSQLLDGISNEAAPSLNGAVVFAAPSPINDVYGDDTAKNCVPTVFYRGSAVAEAFVVTDAAKNKDLGTLLTAIDYLYSPEGSILTNFGLTKEQIQEKPELYGADKYDEWGISDGAYWMDGDTVIVNPAVVSNPDDLALYVGTRRMLGMARRYDVDQGKTDTRMHMDEIWNTYGNAGYIQADLTAQMDADAFTVYNAMMSNVDTVIAQQLPLFIMGQKDVKDDGAWQTFMDEIAALNAESALNALEEILTAK